MTNTDIEVEEIFPMIHHTRYISEQPIDRHLIEITDEHKTVFINAGIDSTCGKKRAKIIHKFLNGTVIPLNTVDSPSIPVVTLLDSLTLNHPMELENGGEPSTSVCRSDNSISKCCSQCGK